MSNNLREKDHLWEATKHITHVGYDSKDSAREDLALSINYLMHQCDLTKREILLLENVILLSYEIGKRNAD